MSELHALQNKVLESIFNGESPNFIKEKGNISQAERFAINKNTVIENLADSLKIDYPGIWKLLGDDCANGVAYSYSYQSKNLTSQDRLSEFGKDFPEFLASFPSTKDISYIKDFATLEWLKSLCFNTKNYVALTEYSGQEKLANITENTRIILNDSIYFLHTMYPLIDIQEIIDNKNAEKVNLSQQKCFIITNRLQDTVETLSIKESYWRFLLELKKNNKIGDAIIYLDEKNIQAELIELIKIMITKEMIIGVYDNII